MELNEVTSKLPRHLFQFIVDQPYNNYTPIDQAVWRYVMMQNYHHLKDVAHTSYVEGLRKTGVEIDNIPTMYGMNRILKEIGWAAVAVDGFIPPGAFMEFTKYNVLVIAADIRTLEHIEYTPAPDIIHESAGHAPIIAEPEFADYLKYIGEAGSRAFSNRKDVELYEAIRHLSIIKEDPDTLKVEIEAAEKAIEHIQSNMGKPSEMALIRNLHWWTVEYGLIGALDNYKLYGAGLLSSIGESKSCLLQNVKKIPYTIEAASCNYDITKPQPQLFVTPDFNHLRTVLDEFIIAMAWKTGGSEGIRKAIDSDDVATLELDSGVQITGVFEDVLVDTQNDPVFLKIKGPIAFAYSNKQMESFNSDSLMNYSFPFGKIKKVLINSEIILLKDCKANDNISLEYESGILVEGQVNEIRSDALDQVLVVDFKKVKVIYQTETLINSLNYSLPFGAKIVSAYPGPADLETFTIATTVPVEKTHKIEYNKHTKELHKLYKRVREIRNTISNFSDLPDIWMEVTKEYPEEWLLPLEIIELLDKHSIYPLISQQIRDFLKQQESNRPELKKLITNGLKLLVNKM